MSANGESFQQGDEHGDLIGASPDGRSAGFLWARRDRSKPFQVLTWQAKKLSVRHSIVRVITLHSFAFAGGALHYSVMSLVRRTQNSIRRIDHDNLDHQYSCIALDGKQHSNRRWKLPHHCADLMHTNDAVTRLAKELLDSGLSCLSEREQKVILHIAKRLNVSQDVNVILAKEETSGERLADRVAQLGGSWGFILVFTGLLAAWVVVNTVILTRFGGGFDPYPYIFLNLILSMVAALQAPVILMSQNRQAARDRLAASLDYEINLKAEVEIMSLHEKLDRIRLERLEFKIEDLSVIVRAALNRLGPTEVSR